MKQLLILSTIVLFFSCKKKEDASIIKPGVVTNPPPNGQMIIFSSYTNIGNWGVLWSGKIKNSGVHGSELGNVKYNSYPPACGTNGFVTIDQPPGTYYIEFKSHDGFAWGGEIPIEIESGKCKYYDFR